MVGGPKGKGRGQAGGVVQPTRACARLRQIPPPAVPGTVRRFRAAMWCRSWQGCGLDTGASIPTQCSRDHPPRPPAARNAAGGSCERRAGKRRESQRLAQKRVSRTSRARTIFVVLRPRRLPIGGCSQSAPRNGGEEVGVIIVKVLRPPPSAAASGLAYGGQGRRRREQRHHSRASAADRAKRGPPAHPAGSPAPRGAAYRLKRRGIRTCGNSPAV